MHGRTRSTGDMNGRIENYKAGETLLHQIKFLLAEVADQETPAIATSRYELDFSQEVAYADARALYADADAAPTAAIDAYNIQNVIRDTQYCD